MSWTKKTIVPLKKIRLVDANLFDLFSSGIGQNRKKLNALDTHNSDDIPVYTAGQMPIVYIKEIKK